VVDNSIDEALAGYADRVAVTHPRRQLDHGRGQRPRHPGGRAPGREAARAVELAMTVLHAGGKFDKNSYKVSGGLHGVGVSVRERALRVLKVWVKRDGKEYYMDFAAATRRPSSRRCARCRRRRPAPRSGSSPTRDLHRVLIYDYGTLQARLRELSFLNKGVTITLKDERPGEEREETFHAEGGLREMVST
jgi:DNA gyrase subunit B